MVKQFQNVMEPFMGNSRNKLQKIYIDDNDVEDDDDDENDQGENETGIMPTIDEKYSHEIAKRSVARAALHLGITSFSTEALDVMADSLLSFLQRLSGYIASSAELSGRSSQHVNILDAIQGLESIHDTVSKESSSSMTNSNIINGARSSHNNNHMKTAWESLAEFGYGENWRKKHDEKQAAHTSTGSINNSKSAKDDKKNSDGSKKDKHNSSDSSNQDNNNTGWNAPYLDLIQNYPIKSKFKNNVYTSEEEACLDSTSSNNSNKLKQQYQNEQERMNLMLKHIPDDAYWGTTFTTTKKDEKEEEEKEEQGDEGKEPTAKRIKFTNEKNTQQNATMSNNNNNIIRPSFLPPFLPSFPPLYTYQPAAAALSHSHSASNHHHNSNDMLMMEQRNNNEYGNIIVQQSLVKFQHNTLTSGAAAPHEDSVMMQLMVPTSKAGMISNSNLSSGSDGTNANLEKADVVMNENVISSSSSSAQNNTVTALSKASGSRIPRILEGSMDTVPCS